MLLKNTCEGVHLIVMLQSISLQPCKVTKNEPLPSSHIFLKDFSQILIYYLLCFFQESFYGRVLQVSMGGGGLFFRWGGFIFQWGRGVPHWGGGGGGIGFDGEGGSKNVGWEGCPPMAPTIGNHVCIYTYTYTYTQVYLFKIASYISYQILVVCNN